MSTTKRKRGGTPRAGPAAAAAASALPAAASTSAVAVPPSRPAASVDWTQTAAGSFHARAPSAAASAFASTGGNMESPSPYNPAKQITPSPRTRGEQSQQLPVRSDSASEDDSSDSTRSEDDNFEADANTAGASVNVSVGRNHANDDKISNNCDLSTHVMDRAVDLFSSSSSSSSSSEDDMLDSDDDDSITKEVMQILEEEVRRGQESEDEMGRNVLESENGEAEDANDDSIAGADAGAGRNSSPTFEVERILARRYNRQRKRIEYLLAWKSGADDPAEHSWEPHEHLDYRAKDHVQERWGGCPNIRASDGIETNDPVLDGPRVAQYRLWEKQQLSLHRRRCKPQLKKKNTMPNHDIARRKALPTRNNFATSQLPIEAENAIAPERPLVPIPRPLVAEVETIEIFWKAGIQPFMLTTDKWELVDDWSLITVYEWRGEVGSDGGLCCVGCHPHRHFPVRTAWRIVSRAGRRGRSKIDRLKPDFGDDGNTKRTQRKASTNASSVTMSPSIPSPRLGGAKRKRPKTNISEGGVKPGSGSGSSPVNGASSCVRTTKAAAFFTDNSKYVGRRVCKCFDGVIHFGTVKKYLSSVNARWAIHYDDDDTEDMNKRELDRAIDLYERKKIEDVGNTSTAEDNGWDFGEDAETDNELSLAAQKPIGLPQIAMEETIEFLWEKGVFPFVYSENTAEVVDDWNDYQIFYWREGSGGGTAIVSYKSHPKVKVRVKWRPMKGRRRRKTNFLKPAKDVKKASRARAQAHARRHSHGRAKKSTITMLELFSGSGVLSDSFRETGVESETLDDDPVWKPNHLMSIAELRKRIKDDTVPEGLNQPKDIVFAAPCCTTFSRASNGRHRNGENLGGHSPEAEAANVMIDDLIFVLKFYKRLNPRCLMVIENPANYLQKMEYNEIFEKEGDDELSLKRVTVSYCMLSEENKLPRKDTHLWTNSKNLHHICRNDALRCYHDCNVRTSDGRRHQKHVQDKDDRYASYPAEFNRFVRHHLLADVRAEQCEVSQLSASFASSGTASSSSSGSECGE